MGDLLDASLLANLTEAEKEEALKAAAIAKRAEERAEERALERARKKREEERRQQRLLEEKDKEISSSNKFVGGAAARRGNNGGNDGGGTGIVFVPKRKRKMQEQESATTKEVSSSSSSLYRNTNNNNNTNKNSKMINSYDRSNSNNGKTSATANSGKRVQPSSSYYNNENNNHDRHRNSTSYSNEYINHNPNQKKELSNWTEKDLQALKASYLGKTATAGDKGKKEDATDRKNGNKQHRTNKKITFRFKWDDTDDTFNDNDPLYNNASISITSTMKKRQRVTNANGNANRYGATGKHGIWGGNNSQRYGGRSSKKQDHFSVINESVYTKPLNKMTTRDWRIFRENYEIVVRGGRAPPPLRTFREGPSASNDPKEAIPKLHPNLLDAIENVMHFKEPTPIQRQAIPIGLRRRDLIGIAETGSGKTVAFGVPLCNYILNLSQQVLNAVSDEGPLALVMAPTRELALQINDEITKLLKKQNQITNYAVVGGQSIQQQAMNLRKGVHIVVGTPGRINECIEMAYLVLNQCYYVVLDEADRMIDMGFAPQIEGVLDAMGGQLKSEDEKETYQQELDDLINTGNSSLPKHRVTAMFSATMPLEVERMAKKYLRHPAVISIGDQDSSKNARIEQRILFLSSQSQKENALRDILNKSSLSTNSRYNSNSEGGEKIIVFVNEKKHADILGRVIERNLHYPVVVLHGGKSQEQRNESLRAFRNGGVVMVATDVAGRGLDIPNVSHVVNYDLPTRSIENYTHRIGRTGRAGKTGLATSFITDSDETIMAPLKAYLESTGNNVPQRLANHPAASSSVQGNLIY